MPRSLPILLVSAMSVIAFGMGGCASSPAPSPTLTGRTATLIVSGLLCPSCAASVESELAKLKGIRSVDVDQGDGVVRLRLDENNPPTEASITDAIRAGGAVLVEIRNP